MSIRKFKRNWSGAMLAIGLLLSGSAGAATAATEVQPTSGVTQVNFAGDTAYTGPYGLTTAGSLTAAGSTVVNDATLEYSVGGSAQDGIAASDGGNQATFDVDRLVDVNVTRAGTLKSGAGKDAYLTFDVRNESNDTVDLLLRPTKVSDDLKPVGTTEISTVPVVRIFLDDGNNSFDINDTALNESGGAYHLKASQSAPGAVTRVHVQLDLGTAASGNWATFELAGSVTDVKNETLAADAVAAEITSDDRNNVDIETGAGSIQNVFADGAGTGDIARDGKHSARDQIEVATADPTISKSSEVIYDPINGLKYDLSQRTVGGSNVVVLDGNSDGIEANPKAIPGAIIRYTITVANNGVNAQAPAEDVVISDDLPSVLAKIATNDASGFPASCTGASLDAASTSTALCDVGVNDSVGLFGNVLVADCDGNEYSLVLPGTSGANLSANVADTSGLDPDAVDGVSCAAGAAESATVTFYMTLP